MTAPAEMARAGGAVADEAQLARALGHLLAPTPATRTVLPLLATDENFRAALHHDQVDELDGVSGGGGGDSTNLATTLASIIAHQLNSTPASDGGAQGGHLQAQNISELDELKLLNFPPVREDLTTAIPLTLIFALLLLTGCIGNICTAIVIARPKNKYMHTATNFYLFSLAMSDFLFLILGLPQEMYALWQRYPYAFGESFCIIRGYLSEASTYASILTISAFTIERYVAICHPLWAHTMSQLPRAITSIVIIWCLAAVCAIPPAAELGIVTQLGPLSHRELEQSAQCATKRTIYENMFVVSAIVFFIVPMIIVTVLYILIAIELRRSSRISSNMSKQHGGQQSQQSNSQGQSQSQLEVARAAESLAHANKCAAQNLSVGAPSGQHCCCQHASFIANRKKAQFAEEPTATTTTTTTSADCSSAPKPERLCGQPRLVLPSAAAAGRPNSRPSSAIGTEKAGSPLPASLQQLVARSRAAPSPNFSLSSQLTRDEEEEASSSARAHALPPASIQPQSFHESLIAHERAKHKRPPHCPHQSSLSQLQVLQEQAAASKLGGQAAKLQAGAQRPASALASVLARPQHLLNQNLSHSQQTIASAVLQQQHQKRLRTAGGGGGGAASSKKSVIRMLVAVVVSFFICWLPFHAQRLLASYLVKGENQNQFLLDIYLKLTYISGVMYYLSSTINPLLYQLMSAKFRLAFKETFKCSLFKCAIFSTRRQSASSALAKTQHSPSNSIRGAQTTNNNNNSNFNYNFSYNNNNGGLQALGAVQNNMATNQLSEPGSEAPTEPMACCQCQALRALTQAQQQKQQRQGRALPLSKSHQLGFDESAAEDDATERHPLETSTSGAQQPLSALRAAPMRGLTSENLLVRARGRLNSSLGSLLSLSGSIGFHAKTPRASFRRCCPNCPRALGAQRALPLHQQLNWRRLRKNIFRSEREMSSGSSAPANATPLLAPICPQHGARLQQQAHTMLKFFRSPTPSANINGAPVSLTRLSSREDEEKDEGGGEVRLTSTSEKFAEMDALIRPNCGHASSPSSAMHCDECSQKGHQQKGGTAREEERQQQQRRRQGSDEEEEDELYDELMATNTSISLGGAQSSSPPSSSPEQLLQQQQQRQRQQHKEEQQLSDTDKRRCARDQTKQRQQQQQQQQQQQHGRHRRRRLSLQQPSNDSNASSSFSSDQQASACEQQRLRTSGLAAQEARTDRRQQIQETRSRQKPRRKSSSSAVRGQGIGTRGLCEFHSPIAARHKLSSAAATTTTTTGAAIPQQTLYEQQLVDAAELAAAKLSSSLSSSCEKYLLLDGKKLSFSTTTSGAVDDCTSLTSGATANSQQQLNLHAHTTGMAPLDCCHLEHERLCDEESGMLEFEETAQRPSQGENLANNTSDSQEIEEDPSTVINVHQSTSDLDEREHASDEGAGHEGRIGKGRTCKHQRHAHNEKAAHESERLLQPACCRSTPPPPKIASVK